MRAHYLFPFLFLLTACTGTHIVQSWRDPDVTVQQGSVKKMLVIALTHNEDTRHAVEDEMVKQFKGRAVASHAYLGALPTTMDVDPFVTRLKGDSIDAMMVMRLVKVDKEQTYVPGSYPTYYEDPFGFYGYAVPLYSDPGYVRTDMTYQVESNFYSVERRKLVWSGISSTVDPPDIITTTDEIVVAIRKKMQEEGFLTPPAGKP